MRNAHSPGCYVEPVRSVLTAIVAPDGLVASPETAMLFVETLVSEHGLVLVEQEALLKIPGVVKVEAQP